MIGSHDLWLHEEQCVFGSLFLMARRGERSNMIGSHFLMARGGEEQYNWLALFMAWTTVSIGLVSTMKEQYAGIGIG